MAFSRRTFAVQEYPVEFLLQLPVENAPEGIIPFVVVKSNKNKSLPH